MSQTPFESSKATYIANEDAGFAAVAQSVWADCSFAGEPRALKGNAGVMNCGSDDNQPCKDLVFDYGGRRHDVIVSISMPDGGKIWRVTEELPGRDKGMYVLKGYKMPDGTLVEKDIHRNTDGSISVLDLDVENRHPDNRHEQRMTEAEFCQWVKEQQEKR